MIETLQSIDANLFMAVNGANCAYLDGLMWNMSSRLAWLPLLLVIIFVLSRKGLKPALFAMAAVAMALLLADQISSGIIKPLAERLRPTHNCSLALAVHVVDGYRGGAYGFVSSHAANLMALSVLLCLMAKRSGMWLTFLSWTLLVSYSRIYLGVHYPGDVACGALVGLVVGLAVWQLWKWCRRWWLPWQHGRLLNRSDVRLLIFSLLANLLIIALIAPFVMLPR